MYTFIKRTVPPPSLLVFDGSSRDQCEVKRLRTNTPLQALVMMNDPQVNEASRVMAERLSLDKNPIEEKIAKAFNIIVCRKATDEEIDILTKYYENEYAILKTKPEDAQKLIRIGEYKHEKVDDTTSLAALIEVVMSIYNLEETIVRS
jgi:hypothetical protein